MDINTWGDVLNSWGDGDSVAVNVWGDVLNSWNSSAVSPDTITTTITILGIPNGPHLITLYNDATDALVLNEVITFTNTVATVVLAGDANTVFTGQWLGDNPPTTGSGLFGTGTSINGTANGFNNEDLVLPLINLVPSILAYTLTAGSTFTLPVSTLTDNNDNTRNILPFSNDVNDSVAGNYTVVYSGYIDSAGNEAEPVTITVTVEAVTPVESVIPAIVLSPDTRAYSISVRGEFTLPTATLTDNNDNTRDIDPFSNNVDLTALGNYEVVYSGYINSAGNEADPITITVAVTGSTLNMLMRDIPSVELIPTRVVNPLTSIVSYNAETQWTNNTATVFVADPVGTNLEYYTIGTNAGGLQRGTTT